MYLHMRIRTRIEAYKRIDTHAQSEWDRTRKQMGCDGEARGVGQGSEWE